MPIVFLAHRVYDRESFLAFPRAKTPNSSSQQPKLTVGTTILAAGANIICAFINDELSASLLEKLAANGTKLAVVRAPSNSPHTISEHTIALILALNRHLTHAYNRTREGDFTLRGLTGFDLSTRPPALLAQGRSVQCLRA